MTKFVLWAGLLVLLASARQARADRASGTVGPSFGPLVPLLDARRVSTDGVNLFANVLEGLRDDLR
jgi:hypothetical protein